MGERDVSGFFPTRSIGHDLLLMTGFLVMMRDDTFSLRLVLFVLYKVQSWFGKHSLHRA